jgi:symplekin
MAVAFANDPSARQTLREDSIRVIASSLATCDHLSPRVLEYATARLAEAVTSADAEAAEPKMKLHLALCARSPELLWAWIHGFGDAAEGVQALMSRLVASLVPHVPIEPLCQILLEAMHQGKVDELAPLMTSALDALVAAGAPSLDFVERVVVLCREQLRSALYCLPLLPHMSAAQAEALLPLVLVLPPETQKQALVSLMHAQPPPLPPPRLMLVLHLLQPGGGGVPLKRLMEAIETCIAERSIFTMQEMMTGLKLIAQQEPLPLLSMRTTIQALDYWEGLKPFTMDLLRHLVDRRVWETPRLWTGFVKCCAVSVPHSVPVLLGLPKAQVLDTIAQHPDLREPLVSYAVIHLAEVSQDVKDALGLADDDAEEL